MRGNVGNERWFTQWYVIKLSEQWLHRQRRTDLLYFSNSLIISQVKTKEISTVKEVWIPGFN